VRVLSVDYHAGLRNPHLERIDGEEDLLSRIIGSAGR